MYQLKNAPHARGNGFEIESDRVDDLKRLVVQFYRQASSRCERLEL